ncbi:GNAT family N-acetyltransferase [Streptomyces sp. P9(2023)]|uniref:GNAT family N-acetyltransferase n=1 Tax=Streptomyces sp. P9(2023) TaxID=3064394 RepID=UPI0028F3FCEF|nr:GNAT family N-acetyltransferase [Streptomyces sp. P9(2023)]MDT9690015.1 GNAT family N-acetyltransferase [Streptomyces sp. P9(2023)]
MTLPATGSLQVSRATLQDWDVVRRWAVAEGWNPGVSDSAAFFAQDPEGFFLGRVDGEPVSAISVVNYSETYAFLGFYLVRPDLRGLGHGLATWRTALTHAGDRTVGLDGVPDQQDNYRRSGFSSAHRTARYVGEPTGPAVPGAPGAPGAPDPSVVPAHDVDPAALAAYDSACHHAERPRFLAPWLATPGHRALARVVDGRVTGYGVVRPSEDEARVGHLFADTPVDAAALLDALAAEARAFGSARIAIDMPEANQAAARLALDRGLEPTFETARMYTGPVRPITQDRVFGVTTLELG